MSRILVIGCAVLIASACGGGGNSLPDEVSDTGYEGTWQRGNERVQSTLAIVKVEGKYLLRHSLNSADNHTRVECDWEGSCEQFIDGEKTGYYMFRTWIDDSSGKLRVEVTGRLEGPTPVDIHYVDQLVLGKEGRLLRAYALEYNDKTYEFKQGPLRNFPKISDHVLDPPKGWSPSSG